MTSLRDTIRSKGPEKGFIALWDLILTDAEGCTYQQAADLELAFDVRNYGLHSDQESQIVTWLKGRATHRRRAVMWTWFSFGPLTIPLQPPGDRIPPSQ